MFLMSIEAGAISSVPYLYGCIITGGGETAAIRGPGNIAYLLVMPLVGEQNPPGGSIQNFCRGISIGQGKTPTVRGPGNRVYPVRARLKGFDGFTSRSIPETDGLVAAGRGNAVALRCPRHG